MTDVTYKGPSDFRVLSAADLPGVEFKKTSFEKGVSHEVSPEVAKTLIEDPQRFGIFEATSQEDPALFELPAKASRAK